MMCTYEQPARYHPRRASGALSLPCCRDVVSRCVVGPAQITLVVESSRGRSWGGEERGEGGDPDRIESGPRTDRNVSGGETSESEAVCESDG